MKLCRRFAVAGCVLGLALVGAGCGNPGFTEIEDKAMFQRVVLDAQQPVLVDFYKGSCPTCVLLEGTMKSLAEEYDGRVTFAQLEAMRSYFAVPMPEINERYDIKYFPTAVLFVNGEERHRWILDYDIDSYREVLNDVLATRVSGGPPAE